MVYYLLSTVYVLVCLLLLLTVLLQQGKGGDIASAFGGGGSQTAFGARQGATVLTRASTVLGAMFMVGALMLAIIGQRGPSSVVGGTAAPAPVQQAPVQAPAPADTPPAPPPPGGPEQPR
jgi:preprotein translocase subunit SecG